MGLEIKPTKQLMTERRILEGQPVQVYVDTQVARLMEKYTPVLSKTMRDSVWVATVFGSGEVIQNAPYARRQYYSEEYHHRGITTHHWFEAMKSNGGVAKILSGAAKLAGARGVRA